MRSVSSKTKLPSASRKVLKERFADPSEILEMMSHYVKEGDFTSLTDLISAYINNSPNYENQTQFAEAIGTTRQTLHRLLSHNDNVSLHVFFSALEKIYEDSLQTPSR